MATSFRVLQVSSIYAKFVWWVVVLTFNCSLKIKYLPETFSAPISWAFICSRMQSSGNLHFDPNSSSYWSEIWATTLPTCLWKPCTACKRFQHVTLMYQLSDCMFILYMCMYVYIIKSAFYSFCFTRTRWKWRSGRDQGFYPEGKRDRYHIDSRQPHQSIPMGCESVTIKTG